MRRKRKQKKSFQSFFLFIAGAAFLGAIIYLLFLSKKHSFFYDDLGVDRPMDFPVLGIDVSHHQGKINYDNLVQMQSGGDSVQFAYVKATEGVDFIDSRYDINAEGFSEKGIPFGFYHYFHPASSARQQAAFFAETIQFYNFKLRPVIDVEVDQGQSAKALADSIQVFYDRVEAIIGTRPILYTYISFYNDYLRTSVLAQEDLWLASYSKELSLIDYPTMLLWQFTEKGTVDGITTYVDLNVGKEGVLDSLKR